VLSLRISHRFGRYRAPDTCWPIRSAMLWILAVQAHIGPNGGFSDLRMGTPDP
jgi:hypothetical protein